jgi:disulfide bond formation protein DsbB
MAMFAVVGVLATAAIYGMMNRWAAWQKTLLIIPAVAAMIIIALAGGVSTRGAVAWWQQPLWRNLLLYAVMFAGMMFRVIWDQLEAWRQHNEQLGARRRRRPRFDFWEFVYPVMPSLALFQGVLWLAGQNELNLQLCLASFQNGFFWHAVLAKTKQNVESTGAKA